MPGSVLLRALLNLFHKKKITETDGNISITFWQSAGVIPITFIAAIFVWDGINGKQL